MPYPRQRVVVWVSSSSSALFFGSTSQDEKIRKSPNIPLLASTGTAAAAATPIAVASAAKPILFYWSSRAMPQATPVRRQRTESSEDDSLATGPATNERTQWRRKISFLRDNTSLGFIFTVTLLLIYAFKCHKGRWRMALRHAAPRQIIATGVLILYLTVKCPSTSL